MKQLKNKGFTLIELIIVTAIISILSTLAYVSYSQFSSQAEDAKKKSDMDAVQSTIEFEKMKEDSFPSRVQ